MERKDVRRSGTHHGDGERAGGDEARRAVAGGVDRAQIRNLTGGRARHRRGDARARLAPRVPRDTETRVGMMGVVSAASIIGGGDGQARRAAASDHPTRIQRAQVHPHVGPGRRRAARFRRVRFRRQIQPASRISSSVPPPTRVHPLFPPTRLHPHRDRHAPRASSPSSRRPTRASLVSPSRRRRRFARHRRSPNDAPRRVRGRGEETTERPRCFRRRSRRSRPRCFRRRSRSSPPRARARAADDDVLGSFGRLNFSWKGALVLYGRGRPDLVRNCRFAGAVSRRISMSRSVPARRRVRKRVGENWTRGRRRVASAKKWTGGS